MDDTRSEIMVKVLAAVVLGLTTIGIIINLITTNL
jgi:hypothetical protein